MTFYTILSRLLLATTNIAQNDTIVKPKEVIDQKIKTLIEMPTDELIHSGIKLVIDLGLKILAAFVIYFVGGWIIKRIRYILKKIMTKRKVEASLMTFILSFTNITLTIILIIIVIGALGIDTTSLVALIAGSGLAIGMAMSGTLQNFAGGIMILLFKPFKVGDYIQAQGYDGTVSSIEITNTKITTPDNKKIILPNGSIINGVINNFSTTGTRRCEWKVSISYGDDVTVAKEEILKIIKSNPLVILEPAAPMVALETLGESALVITARAWVNSKDYWTLFYNINEEIYNRLPKAGIRFPYPQMDINIKKDDK